jgi:hypothetical protein
MTTKTWVVKLEIAIDENSHPRTIHGRVFNTEAEYKEALADFINGL